MTPVRSDQDHGGLASLLNPLLVALGLQAAEPVSPPDGAIWADALFPALKARLCGQTREPMTDFITTPYCWKPSASTNAVTAVGFSRPTALGTLTAAVVTTTNKYTRTPRAEYLVTTAATTAVCAARGTNNVVTVGGASAGLGGFRMSMIWGPATGCTISTHRAFAGLAVISSAPTDVDPSTTVNCVAMGWDAADANVQMMFNDASGTCTKVDLGASFPVPSTDRSTLYELELYSPPGTTQTVYWRVTNLITGDVTSGTQTTDLPIVSGLLAPRLWMSVGGTSSVIGMALGNVYLDPLV